MNPPPIGIPFAFGHAWRLVRKHFLHLFLVTAIVFVANHANWLISYAFGAEGTDRILMQWIAVGYKMLVFPVIAYGGAQAYLECMRGNVTGVHKLFRGFRDKFLTIILASLLSFAIVCIGLLLLILPGIVFIVRLSFVPFLVMDLGLDPIAAVEKSWTMTRGHGWRIFGVVGLIILTNIAELLVLVVGMIPDGLLDPGMLALIAGLLCTRMWVQSAFASLYFSINCEEQNLLDQDNGATPSESEAHAS